MIVEQETITTLVSSVYLESFICIKNLVDDVTPSLFPSVPCYFLQRSKKTPNFRSAVEIVYDDRKRLGSSNMTGEESLK